MKLIQALPLFATLVLAACGSAPAAQTSSPIATASVPPTPEPTSLPSSDPSWPPTQEPTPEPDPTPESPPDGALGYSDFADVGWLGSYCWHGTCADVSAIPPKSQLPEIVVRGDALIFSLATGEFTRWVAQHGSDSTSFRTFAEGGESSDAMEWVEFDVPPSGDWLVRIQAFLVDGDASYYWHVIVP